MTGVTAQGAGTLFFPRTPALFRGRRSPMPLRTHRQRVPAMLAVACLGMLVYAVAGASPDGLQLAPAACPGPQGTGTTATPSCSDPAPASTSATTDKGGAGNPTSTTTAKGGSGGS